MSTLLRLATAGSVDDGKSTLVGRLLHDTKSIMADQLEAVERVSADRGLEAADLALLTDGLRAEREQGDHHRRRLPLLRHPPEPVVHPGRLPPRARAVHP